MKEIMTWLRGCMHSQRSHLIYAGISCMCTVIVLWIFYQSSVARTEAITIRPAKQIQDKNGASPSTIFVDVSGAVRYPGMIELTSGARFSDALDKAGGLSARADTDFYARNYNAARVLHDQEKIYIPRIDEVAQGIFIEGRYVINHSLERAAEDEESGQGGGVSDDLAQSADAPASDAVKLDINSATEAELDTLPGVGPATAKKIIGQRPYATLDDLLEKKSVTQGTYDKIIDLIAIQ